LHLALGHQREDQAETLVLRLARGSGLDGLAAMPAIVEFDRVRLLRPLLSCPRERLRAFLARRGQEWIEDPSNRRSAFARVRVRDALAANDGGDLELAATARRLGGARAALESATAALLARAAAVHPAGFCTVDREAFAAAPPEVTLRAVARILTCIGGAGYPPRREQLERLVVALASRGAPPRRTLAGCIVTGFAGSLCVVREPRAVARPADIRPGEEIRWDGRFRVSLAGRPRAGRRFRVAALGGEGWRAVRRCAPALADGVPPEAGAALPALWDGRALRALPDLGARPRGAATWSPLYLSVSFRPAQPLAGAVFSVV
jgi:tRNA(Ile)-lysidine synthase